MSQNTEHGMMTGPYIGYLQDQRRKLLRAILAPELELGQVDDYILDHFATFDSAVSFAVQAVLNRTSPPRPVDPSSRVVTSDPDRNPTPE